MYINNPKLTMRQAAEQFVADHFEERKVGKWVDDCFQLVDGVKWYRVTVTGIGWDINEIEYTPRTPRTQR